MIDNFGEISTADGLRVGTWIVGEYSDCRDPVSGSSMMNDGFEAITKALGPSPI